MSPRHQLVRARRVVGFSAHLQARPLGKVTPTALLLLAAAVAAIRSRRVPCLAPASRALCALMLLDVYHHACRPLLDARRAGAALSVAEVWALRLDAWIVAGGWCAVVAWLLLSSAGGCDGGRIRCETSGARSVSRSNDFRSGTASRGESRRAKCRAWCPATCAVFLIHGLAAVAVARLWPSAWTPLLIAPRFAVGALAWWSSGASGENRTPSPRGGRAERRGPSSFYTGRNTNGPRRIVDLGRAVRRGLGCRYLGSLAPSRAFRRLTAGWSGDPPNDGRMVAPSLLIGQIIAACQVGAAAFLWSRWGDVRILSSACWAACVWIAWRTPREEHPRGAQVPPA